MPKKSEQKIDTTPGAPCSTAGWCPGMKMALDGDHDMPTGFTVAHMFSMSGAPSRSALVYKPRKKGSFNIQLVVCPWCRKELDPICNPPSLKRTKKVSTSAG